MANRLIECTSPYLLQHAENPVDWYPWGSEALEKARDERKPILLSIGYSACHWCHVMAHESFEDDETARLMNKGFINIKVDREQRPDLDKIYQTAHQLIARRSGGWPLTMFLTHDTHLPFFGGTYFPPEPRYNMPSFQQVLSHVLEAYQQDHDAIVQHNRSMQDVLQRIFHAPSPPPDTELNPAPLRQALHELTADFDSMHGGFGGAPKFPHAATLQLLLHYYNYAHEDTALDLLLVSLTKMARGGIYDHIGGGFARYAVDERWEIPHFEKMLYDNGPLIELYATAWAIDGNPLFAKIATDSARWVMREMQAPEGGYYSALDADSEGEEGKFYVWDRAEVEREVPSADFPLVASYFGLEREPNFEGHWHLYATTSPSQLAQQFAREEDDVILSLDRAVTSLFWARSKRIRPGLDNKILGAWNGLMIRGMATAGRMLGREDFIASAERALEFARTQLWDGQRLCASHSQGRSEFTAYLDDYAFLADGALALLQARWNPEHLTFARSLLEILLHKFTAPEGGFYFTAHDHEPLIQRPCQFSDDALPAGNAVAAGVLLKFGHILGEPRYLQAAENALRAAWSGIQRSPVGHCSSLSVLCDYLSSTEILILRGEADDLLEWQMACQRDWVAHRVILSIPPQATDLPRALADKPPIAHAAVTAYRCQGMRCSAPITDLAEWQRFLQ